MAEALVSHHRRRRSNTAAAPCEHLSADAVQSGAHPDPGTDRARTDGACCRSDACAYTAVAIAEAAPGRTRRTRRPSRSYRDRSTKEIHVSTKDDCPLPGSKLRRGSELRRHCTGIAAGWAPDPSLSAIRVSAGIFAEYGFAEYQLADVGPGQATDWNEFISPGTMVCLPPDTPPNS